MSRLSWKLILITSMVGMSVCYAVLGGCFYIIEANMKQGKGSQFEAGWVPPLAILLLLFLGNCSASDWLTVVT